MEVPHCNALAPLASTCFVLCLVGVATEGLLDCQVRAGIFSIVRWHLSPVIFGVEHVNARHHCIPDRERVDGEVP